MIAAGITEQFSEVYVQENKSALIYGIPFTKIYKIKNQFFVLLLKEKKKIDIDGSQGTQFIYNGENIKYNGNEKEQIQEITKMKKGERVLEWNAGKCCCRIYGSLSYEELKEIAKNVEVKI